MSGYSSSLPFKGIKVVELAEDSAGELTGRLFADLGAEVIKLEPPQGAPSRYVGPFDSKCEEPDHSLNFRFYNREKKSVVLDVANSDGKETLVALLQTADIFVCTLQPAALARLGLDYQALGLTCPRLIIISVTPFGLTGPWRDYKSSDLIGLAAGGPLHMTGYSDHSIPPIRPGGDQAYHTAASFAYSGALLALLHRRTSKRGQLVDVSMHDSCAVTVEMAFAYWVYAKSAVHRQTCRHAQPEPSQPTLFECADGRYIYFVLVLAQAKPWKQLVTWLDSHGYAADLKDQVYSNVQYRQDNFHHVQGICEAFFLTHNADDMFREGQIHQLPVGVLYRPQDLLHDPHLRERGFFEEVDEESGEKVIYPGPPSRFSALKPRRRRGAPKLGAHTSEILAATT
jgi:crotonobetainyl-CoA:carnitine CoA-transferase CaiB-like acyl-CoA transferase